MSLAGTNMEWISILGRKKSCNLSSINGAVFQQFYFHANGTEIVTIKHVFYGNRFCELYIMFLLEMFLTEFMYQTWAKMRSWVGITIALHDEQKSYKNHFKEDFGVVIQF